MTAAVVESELTAVVEPERNGTVTPVAEIAVPEATAEDGTADSTPRPNAATATSAMRLNVVFVDICFLSIVELRTIRISA